MQKRYQRYLKFLIWPGLTLATAGLVTGWLASWTLLPLVLLAVGVVMMAASLLLGGYAWRSFWQQRSTQAGTNALVATLSVLMILGLVNFLGARYDQRIDLTEAQLFTLAPESQQVVKALTQPVKVVVFEGAPNPTDQQLLTSYRRLNPSQFSFEYIDPYARPQQAQAFGVQTVGETYLQAGDQRVLVQRLNQQERLSEKQLTNRLAQLGQNQTAVVYFMQGNGEYKIDGTEAGFLQAATALEEDNFKVAALNLAEAKAIPQDAAVVVIAGPQQELFAAEQQALEKYLKDGGSVLLLVDPQIKTGLEPFLATWGVTLNDRLIVDTSGGGQLVGLGPAAPLVTDYGAHPITEAFKNGRSFYPLARPLMLKEVAGVTATPLLLTNPQTYAEPISASGELQVNTQQSPEGPFTLGVALSRSVAPEAKPAAASTPQVSTSPVEPPAEPREARMVVIGNASFATDRLFEQQLNGDVFLNSVSWLSKIDTPTLSIRAKDVTDRRIVMTVQQQLLVMGLALLVLPGLGLVGAGVMWFRRR
jgi:ABC-type uncharacterized transport system involved in gliding motility auxiliary subunit